MAIEVTTAPTETAIADADLIYFNDVSETPDAINQITFANMRSSTFASGAVIDGGALSSFELPNSAAPTVNADGEVAVDTTITDMSHGLIKYFSGEECAVIAVPVAELTGMSNGDVIKYNATNDEFEIGAASGGIGGSLGATDNVIVRADGTGGATAQGSSATVSDAGDVIAAAGRYFMVASSDIQFGDLLGTGDSVVGYNGGKAVKFRDNGGTIGFQVDASATATHTRMLVWDVDNAALERVTVGAADSGGSGFKVLRIPN
jgi:hypothetical protein